METAFFWIVFPLVSFWVLKTFYFSRDPLKFNNLRKTAFWIDYTVLILFFLPWLPAAQGRTTGWELIRQGNVAVLLLGVLIAGSLLALFTKNKSLLKAGIIAHIISSILFIAVMINLMPGTVVLDLGSIAAIIASLFLLSGNVVALLLWQQMR